MKSRSMQVVPSSILGQALFVRCYLFIFRASTGRGHVVLRPRQTRAAAGRGPQSERYEQPFIFTTVLSGPHPLCRGH